MKWMVLLLTWSTLYCTVSAQEKTDQWLRKLLYDHASPLLRKVLDSPMVYQYQIIYTRIDRDQHNKPHFRNFYVNVDRSRYFNPASTVKLPTALAALEKLNTMQIAGLSKFTPMLTDSGWKGQTSVRFDTSAADGVPSIAQYIKKIFLISDNDAYNRLYEFTGQAFLNQSLWNKGYGDARITRRFVPMDQEENRHTNPIRFVKNGHVIFSQPAAYSDIRFHFGKPIRFGIGHWNEKDSLINEPMDFTTHNNLPLEDLQQILQSVLFPRSVPSRQRFLLTNDDRAFLLHYMSAYPRESVHPTYDTSEYFNSYAKFFYKSGRQPIPDYIRIYNKPGWSYGFLTDAGYVIDSKHKVEFMLSAVIYVNADGILNDNKYEYEEIGYPFFHDVYDIIYAYELNRPRTFRPASAGVQ